VTDRSLSADARAHVARAAGQPQPDLREQLAEALRTAPSVLMDTPEERDRHAANPRNHHIGHHYYWGCAMCRGEVDTLADAVHAVVQERLDAKQAELASLRTTARSAAVSLRDTAERVEQGRTVNAAALRAAARALDDITGSTP
jgi:ElaB/YqjD/DUF883 family membrane-anchored ribosome-binding protein